MNAISPHDRPNPVELLDAVRELLVDDVLPVLDGRTRFHVRVAVNVVDIVKRELQLGDEHAQQHAIRLANLGVADDEELARGIRRRDFDDRYDEVSSVVRQAVWDKLTVANPNYRAPYDSPSAAREPLNNLNESEKT